MTFKADGLRPSVVSLPNHETANPSYEKTGVIGYWNRKLAQKTGFLAEFALSKAPGGLAATLPLPRNDQETELFLRSDTMRACGICSSLHAARHTGFYNPSISL